MRTMRAVSSARARKLRKLGERVWFDPAWEVLVWDMAASKRLRRIRVYTASIGLDGLPFVESRAKSRLIDWKFA